ncbi:hypothetical protein KAFR_0D04360 [Kazachstania africana CBS 2517]|uniref:Uncharacterized protein n=1 Tax=Kazachstania africana (strain ATCC 22294 / BCRC 22015 / CBS 2517 / CECT 1963 / NBRC 1671 / NRRL Y-8276) TaxID=1071382 RepID=H2AUN4_KAZAF|nr:hypothetical protein KAFR_0D04360 [Kazachstania africana CBS 2517]CCF58084.1 hypothetical protein KAFR_0D04360 [Kazachstania africana CBS 2517]
MRRCLFRQFSVVASCVRQQSTLALRDYQQDAINSCIQSIKNGTTRIGVSLATGGGKTVIFSNLIQQLKEASNKPDYKALVLVHRRELALQASGTIQKFFPQARVQLEMGKFHCSIEESDIVIASIQSLVRRLDKYKNNNIDLIIVDEAHHAVANSYIKILSHFGANTAGSKIPVIGFSATFERADNKALSTVIDEIVYHRGILKMIDEKWLCEGKFTTVNVDVDLSKVETLSSNVDFKLDSLSKVMNTEEVNKIVLKSYLHKREKDNLRSTLLFAVDIAHVKSLHDVFIKNGVKAEYVTSDTKEHHRDAIIQEFREGKIEVLMNCGIFTEGTDMPNIDCLLLCRPTKSRSLMVQMIGRGLRLHHSKAYCHIIDFVGASNVGIISIPTLTGITNFEGDLDDATLDDLNEIKKEMERKSQLLYEKKKLEIEKTQKAYEDFKKSLQAMNSLELTLTTFGSFAEFCKISKPDGGTSDYSKSSTTAKEVKFILKSEYPWVKYSTNAWAFPLHNESHLRLSKEKDENKSTFYTLKLCRLVPKHLRYEIPGKFIPRELIKDGDLLNISGKVNEVIKTLSAASEGKIKNFTKFTRWRQEPATVGQRKAICGAMKSVYSSNQGSFKRLTTSDINLYVEKLSKGDAANIIFSMSLAPVYPLKALLRILDYKVQLKG